MDSEGSDVEYAAEHRQSDSDTEHGDHHDDSSSAEEEEGQVPEGEGFSLSGPSLQARLFVMNHPLYPKLVQAQSRCKKAIGKNGEERTAFDESTQAWLDGMCSKKVDNARLTSQLETLIATTESHTAEILGTGSSTQAASETTVKMPGKPAMLHATALKPSPTPSPTGNGKTVGSTSLGTARAFSSLPSFSASSWPSPSPAQPPPRHGNREGPDGSLTTDSSEHIALDDAGDRPALKEEVVILKLRDGEMCVQKAALFSVAPNVLLGPSTTCFKAILFSMSPEVLLQPSVACYKAVGTIEAWNIILSMARHPLKDTSSYLKPEIVPEVAFIAKTYGVHPLLEACLSATQSFQYNITEGSSTDAVLWIKLEADLGVKRLSEAAVRHLLALGTSPDRSAELKAITERLQRSPEELCITPLSHRLLQERFRLLQEQFTSLQCYEVASKKPIIRLNSGRMADVVQALKWAAREGPCIVDLSGRAFSGYLAEDLSFPRDTTLRNGTLKLHDAWKVCISAQEGVVLENLTIKSAGKANTRVVEISDGSDVQMCKCRLEGAGGCDVSGSSKLEAKGSIMMSYEGTALSVEKGGKVELEQCDCSGGTWGYGWYVMGVGSSLEAKGSAAKGSEGYASAYVGEAASAVISSCRLVGCDGGHGLAVDGKGSSVIAINCNFSDNGKSSVFVSGGGQAMLDACECTGSKEGAGLHAMGKGSLLLAKRCSTESNKMGGEKKERGGKVMQF